MGTTTEIITDAFHEGNLLDLDEAPTSAQLDYGLRRLNRFLESLFGYEIGEKPIDWPIPFALTAPQSADYPLMPRHIGPYDYQLPYPPSNVRVLLNLVADTTIYLDQAPSDGARVAFVNVNGSAFNVTVSGNGRKIRGATTYTATAEEWDTLYLFYRSDLGEWTLLNTELSLTDETPLPAKYDEFLMLAVFFRVCRTFGRRPDEEQVSAFQRLKAQLQAQYRQRVPVAADQDSNFALAESQQYFNGVLPLDSNGSLL